MAKYSTTVLVTANVVESRYMPLKYALTSPNNDIIQNKCPELHTNTANVATSFF